MALGWVVDVIGPLLTKTYIAGGLGRVEDQGQAFGFVLGSGCCRRTFEVPPEGPSQTFLEPDELDRSAVVDDHGGADALGRGARRMDSLLPHEGGLEVIDLERDVRDRSNQLVNRAVFLESHPLDAVGGGAYRKSTRLHSSHSGNS